jgi:hypothetical protein
MRIFTEYEIEEIPNRLLVDEHRTHHCLYALMTNKLKVNPNFTWMGYTKETLKARHDLVVAEMIRRNYNHHYKSEIDDGCLITTKPGKFKS